MGWRNALRDNKGRFVKKTPKNKIFNWFKRMFA